MERRLFCNTVEAKARLNELLQEVTRGREVIVRRRGKVIARILSASGEVDDPRKETLQFMSRLKEFQRRLRRKHGPENQTLPLLRQIREEA